MVSSVFILRMVLQETYEVLDAVFYDTGVSGTANTNWTSEANANLQRLTEYSSLSEISTSSNTIIHVKEGSSPKQFPNNILIEMDIKQVDGINSDTILDIRANGTGLTASGLSMSHFGFNDHDWHSIKIKLEANKVSAMIGDTVINTRTPSVTADYWLFGLWTANTTSEIHFKNVRIYSA